MITVTPRSIQLRDLAVQKVISMQVTLQHTADRLNRLGPSRDVPPEGPESHSLMRASRELHGLLAEIAAEEGRDNDRDYGSTPASASQR